MSTIQNLKNFIRHGKQARDGRSPQDQATTHVSPVHAQQHRGYQNYNGAPPQAHHGISEPNVYEHKPLQGHAPQQDYSAQPVDNRGQAARAGHAAANAVDRDQKKKQQQQEYDSSVLERIVAEERESKGKLPRYPGLERYQLIEKMGDGAFSNVYRAKDTHQQYNEVAIKVVRKFEMNSQQVSTAKYSLATVVPTPRLWLCLYGMLLANTPCVSGRRPPRFREEGPEDRGGAQCRSLFSPFTTIASCAQMRFEITC